ncbi:MAG: hypothetical protein AB7W59_04830 [Acidimicrobiia bacterium]
MTSFLDPKTLDRLTEIAIDRDGAFERTGKQLQQLLEHGGWPDEVCYDGSPKRQWLRDTLDDQADNQPALERFICRLCDPIEYNHTEAPSSTANVYCDAVNDVLRHERLTVTQVGGRPVLVKLTASGTTPSFAMPADLDNRLAALIDDQHVVKFLVERADEAQRAESAGAYTLAVIGIGSFIEGLLAAFLETHDDDYRTGCLNINGRIDPSNPKLFTLIDAAHAQGWIEMDAKDFLQQVRQYRNYIHPREHLENDIRFDSDSVMLCWGPVHAALKDLESSHARIS